MTTKNVSVLFKRTPNASYIRIDYGAIYDMEAVTGPPFRSRKLHAQGHDV